MRFIAGVLAIAACAGCQAARSPFILAPEGASAAASEAKPAQPGWTIPPYSAAQQAILDKPVEQPIRTPAARVLPDLSRFWYADNRPLPGPEQAIRFARLVVKVLDDSPRFYALDSIAPELANPLVQYGPPAGEPDGWVIAKRGEGGVGELVKAPDADAAKADFDAAEGRAKAGDLPGAIEAHRAAIAKHPKIPALRVALAAALAKSGDGAAAEAAYQEAIAVDPTFAPPYLGLAELEEKRGEITMARKHLVEALALNPASQAAIALADRLAAGGSRVTPFALFLDVDKAGAIHAAASGGPSGQMYAGCRAMMRYEPSVRAQIFDQPEDVPYYLSVVEEVICLEAALGSYVLERSGEDASPPDPNLDALLALARDEGLSGFAMVEVLGRRRPERARTAPPEVHKAMTTYVEGHILGQKIPAGVYTVERGGRDEQDRAARAIYAAPAGGFHGFTSR